MWYDSGDNGEPLHVELSQRNDTSPYQLFGSLGENLSQYDFDPFTDQTTQGTADHNAPRYQAEAWPDMGCSLFMQELPAGSSAPSGHFVQGDGFAQASQVNSPTDWQTNVAINYHGNVQSKSTILNKIQNLESTRFALDEEIEEQQQRNISLEKQVAYGQEQLSKMQVQSMILKNELQAITEKNREFELQLDHEIWQLTNVIEEKRRKIWEIKYDAYMMQTLRNDKEKVRYEIRELQEELDDIDLDTYWMDFTFRHDLDRMVIFPFWKLEEDLERALNGEDPTLYDEPGPPERDDDEDDGYDYEDDDEEEEESDESSLESRRSFVESNRTFSSDSNKSSNDTTGSDSCHSSAQRTTVKGGSKFSKLLSSVFHGRKAARKRKQKKVSMLSRFGDWLGRLSCISNGNKED